MKYLYIILIYFLLPITTTLSAQAETTPAIKTGVTVNATAAMSNKININQASAAELQLLKGIGESKAKAIVEYRKQQGDFKDISELTQVRGIGEKLIAQNRERLVL